MLKMTQKIVIFLTLNHFSSRSYTDESIVKKEYIINCTAWDSLINECKNLKQWDYISLYNCIKKDSNPLEFSIQDSDNDKPKDLMD